ncbi:hypothetical protein OH76DRAFT_1487952 [Lentinus brumalis]|uniref:Uncharacterized protein n=1 Tax=Lentinus brumalis TaxID=2498619 RepID=A0A371CSX7_9APHY|nr:hypothetical protein OH76DRAFT_1487952 [Polyporus brumalis]
MGRDSRGARIIRDFVITRPNMTWAPKFAIAHGEITTYTDGRWGIHEYSRWPRSFLHDLFHVPCIPAKSCAAGPGPVCWRTLGKSDWKVDDCGILNVGVLEAILHGELIVGATSAITRYRESERTGNGWEKTGDIFVVCLLLERNKIVWRRLSFYDPIYVSSAMYHTLLICLPGCENIPDFPFLVFQLYGPCATSTRIAYSPLCSLKGKEHADDWAPIGFAFHEDTVAAQPALLFYRYIASIFEVQETMFTYGDFAAIMVSRGWLYDGEEGMLLAPEGFGMQQPFPYNSGSRSVVQSLSASFADQQRRPACL